MLGKNPLRFVSWSTLAAAALAACAGAPPPPAKAKPPPELPKLVEQRDELKASWASADADIQQRCEMSVGDCMLHVRDRRFELLSIHTFPECDHESGDKRDFCEEQRAVERGMGQEIVGYYEYHNKCMSQMLECTAQLEAEALEAATMARAEHRKLLIQSQGKNESALVDALAAKEGVSYLRATLPPKEEGVCQDMEEVKSCLTSTQEQDKALLDELRKDDGEYSDEFAASMFQEARQAEAACYEPEFECLKQRARKYGATGETLRSLKNNIEVLKQRERLSLRVAKASVDQCKANAVSQHQKSIVSAYTTYARQPVLFFRQKLHSAFLKMHRDQVACLRGQPVADPAAAPPPPSKKPSKQPGTRPEQPKQPPKNDSRLQAKR